jgi:hypothetical protein
MIAPDERQWTWMDEGLTFFVQYVLSKILAKHILMQYQG